MVATVIIWKQKTIKTIKYWYSLSYWYCLNAVRALGVYLKQQADLVRRAFFIFAALGIAWLVNSYGLDFFTQDILSNYLVAVGTMTGGAIAIIFTISLTVFSTSASAYPALFSEVDTSSYREKLTYFLVGLITLLHLGAGLYVGGLRPLSLATDGDVSPVSLDTSALIVIFSLFLVSIVFMLIDWQYKTIKEKSDPFFAIVGFERNAVRKLKRMQKDAESISDILQAKDASLSRDMARATAFNKVLHPFTAELEVKLISLIETALKFADKQEVHTTRRAFNAVQNVLYWFFEVRKTSSLIIPSGLALLGTSSDSQNLLSRVFEKLNDAAEKFIKEGKGTNVTYIVDVYKNLAYKSQEITFIGRANENPILDLIVGYLGFVIDAGRKAKNNEVVYQGAQALGDIAVIAASKGYAPTLHGMHDNIMKIAHYGMIEKYTFIVDQCVTNYLKIIGAVFGSTKIIRSHSFDDTIKHIATISGQLLTLVQSGGLPNDFTTLMSMGKSYDDLQTLIAAIMNRYTKLTDEREKQTYRGDVEKFFDKLGMSIRQLSGTIKNADSILVDSVGRLLSNVNQLLVDLIKDDEFSKEVEDFKKSLSRNIHLPSWFAIHAAKFDGGSNPFNTLTDSVAKTGILVVNELEDKKLAQAAIDSLYSITKQALEKTTSGYGYDEPRVLEKACYIGILAQKKGWTDVVVNLKTKIQEFEALYFTKHLTNLPAGLPAGFNPRNHNIHGLPRHDQLMQELRKWRHDFDYEQLNGNLRMRDDAEAMMYASIERDDIDNFVEEIWGIRLQDEQITIRRF